MVGWPKLLYSRSKPSFKLYTDDRAMRSTRPQKDLFEYSRWISQRRLINKIASCRDLYMLQMHMKQHLPCFTTFSFLKNRAAKYYGLHSRHVAWLLSSISSVSIYDNAKWSTLEDAFFISSYTKDFIQSRSGKYCWRGDAHQWQRHLQSVIYT